MVVYYLGTYIIFLVGDLVRSTDRSSWNCEIWLIFEFAHWQWFVSLVKMNKVFIIVPIEKLIFRNFKSMLIIFVNELYKLLFNPLVDLLSVFRFMFWFYFPYSVVLQTYTKIAGLIEMWGDLSLLCFPVIILFLFWCCLFLPFLF